MKKNVLYKESIVIIFAFIGIEVECIQQIDWK